MHFQHHKPGADVLHSVPVPPDFLGLSWWHICLVSLSLTYPLQGLVSLHISGSGTVFPEALVFHRMFSVLNGFSINAFGTWTIKSNRITYLYDIKSSEYVSTKVQYQSIESASTILFSPLWLLSNEDNI